MKIPLNIAFFVCVVGDWGCRELWGGGGGGGGEGFTELTKMSI